MTQQYQTRLRTRLLETAGNLDSNYLELTNRHDIVQLLRDAASALCGRDQEKGRHAMNESERTDLQYLADIFGRRGVDWIVSAIGARPVVDSGAASKDIRSSIDAHHDDARTKTVDELKRWIADLDVVIAKRRGNGLGAESKTFELVDRQKTLRAVVRLLEPVKPESEKT